MKKNSLMWRKKKGQKWRKRNLLGKEKKKEKKKDKTSQMTKNERNRNRCIIIC